MNYISHLTAFFERASMDTRLNTTHISMYMSLFQFWNFNRFKNPISISRSEIMKVSKISAIATYHKCIKELNAFGYIIYEPSYNPFKGSLVKMLDFEKGKVAQSPQQAIHQSSSEQALNQASPKNKHVEDSLQSGIEQALVPYINNNKHIKPNKTLFVDTQTFFLNIEKLKKVNFQKRKVAPKEKSTNSESITSIIPNAPVIPSTIVIPSEARNLQTPQFKIPHISEVKLYFEEKDAPIEEGEKFYNHYESNGWLVGGKSKMKNWQAAARNWLLNSKKFNNRQNLPLTDNHQLPTKTNHLSASIKKSYQDPL